MSGVPAVIVKKGGFLSALFNGLFGFLTVTVICASGLGVYALHIADNKVGGLLTMTGDLISDLPQWQQSLPPLLAETLDDRRAPQYREQVDVSVRAVTSSDSRDREQTVVEVVNKGSETISVLALNVVLEDKNGVPVRENRVYAATPIAIDEAEWRGPLFPHDARRFVVCRCGHEGGLRPTFQIAELRVWNGPDATEAVELGAEAGAAAADAG